MTFEEAFNTIKLPKYNYISILGDSEFLPNKVEAHRRFDDLISIICSARFNLVMSFQESYKEYEKRKGDNLWIKSQFIINALNWYNSAIDMLIQVICFYFEYGSPIKTSADVLSLLRSNTLRTLPDNSFEKIEIRKFKEDHKDVSELANSLKHRQWIRFNDIYNEDVRYIKGKESFKQDGLIFHIEEENFDYNSAETILTPSFEETQSLLITYHNDLLDLVERLTCNLE